MIARSFEAPADGGLTPEMRKAYAEDGFLVLTGYKSSEECDALASRMADLLLERGIYVIGFSYPVVPKGQARIRTQMSAGLERAHLDRAIDAFIAVGKELEVIS